MSEYSLGAILLENGVLSRSQLEEALQKQQQQADTVGWQLLGEILVESRLVSPGQLQAALAEQAKRIEYTFFTSRPHPSTRSRFKRSLDIVGSILGLLLLLLLLPAIALAIYLQSPGPILVSQPRVGLRGKQFKLWRFRSTAPGAERYRLKIGSEQGNKLFNLDEDPQVTPVGRFLRRFYIDEMPQFINVLKGEMSLIGTRPPTMDEVKFYTKTDWQRLVVKPGITGLWQINRRKYDMSFEDVLAIDFSYIDGWSKRLELKILAKTVLHILLGAKRKKSIDHSRFLPEVSILGVPMHNLTVMELLRQLTSGVVFTPNVDHLMKLQRDQDFFNTYLQADYRVCDSQILLYASRFLGKPLKEKISGSDFFPAFCRFHRNNPDVTIFLLGGAPGVADRARDMINSKIGREIVIASHSPSFGFERSERECHEIIQQINQTQATVLAVGVGAPKQEKWIHKYKDQFTHVKIFLAVGATIDFEAGAIKRAPRWMSKLGVEWLFRITADPKRLWKRYLVDDLPFFWLLLKQKLGIYQPPFSRRQASIVPTIVK